VPETTIGLVAIGLLDLAHEGLTLADGSARRSLAQRVAARLDLRPRGRIVEWIRIITGTHLRTPERLL
jgi:hypothetical protein